jgi:hypothetical protein
MYINYFSVFGNSSAKTFHEKLIHQLVCENLCNQQIWLDFAHINLRETFFPNQRNIPSFKELGCDRAYIDDRLRPGECLKIISINGVPSKLHELYLHNLAKIDPAVKLEMYTCTGHPGEEWIDTITLVNDAVTHVASREFV